MNTVPPSHASELKQLEERLQDQEELCDRLASAIGLTVALAIASLIWWGFGAEPDTDSTRYVVTTAVCLALTLILRVVYIYAATTCHQYRSQLRKHVSA